MILLKLITFKNQLNNQPNYEQNYEPNNKMTDRLYFKGHAFKGVLFEGKKGTGSETFDTWLAEKDWDEELAEDDCEFECERAVFDGIDVLGNFGLRREWVYDISEEWKHTLFDRLATEIDIDDAEKIIGEVGIRKVMKLANDSGFYDDEGGLPELWTDMGIRKVFYNLLDYTLDINEEYYDEITKEEYDEWITKHIESDDDDVCGVVINAVDFAKMTFAEQKAWIKSQDPNRKDIVCPIDFNKKTCDELRKCLRDIFADVNEEDKKRNLRGVGKMKKEMLVAECERWTEYLMSDKGKAEFKQLKENK